MNGRYLLDTNIVVSMLRGRLIPAPLVMPAEYCVSAITRGELVYGALRSSRVSEGLIEVVKFLEQVPVVPCTGETASRYAYLRASLAASGELLPQNDMWIAATALQHGLTLVTRDAHFDVIPHLPKERW